MANGGKLLSAMVVTALWLPVMEGVMAAGRQDIGTPTQGMSGELWPLSGAMQLGLPKAEALRQAQIALITGDYTAVGGRRGDIEIRGGPGQASRGDPLAHPYYWAPFILIGNGL